MNIDYEIEQLEKQIESLKQKKEKDKLEKNRKDSLKKLTYGQLFIRDNCDSYIALVFTYTIDHAEKWGYVFDDGSGECFTSKESLIEYFTKNNFSFYGKLDYFSPI